MYDTALQVTFACSIRQAGQGMFRQVSFSLLSRLLEIDFVYLSWQTCDINDHVYCKPLQYFQYQLQNLM